MSKHLVVTPEVCAAMGMTAEGLSELTLAQFKMMAFYKGYDVRVGGFDVPSEDGNGGLTVKMDDDKRPIVHVGRQQPQETEQQP